MSDTNQLKKRKWIENTATIAIIFIGIVAASILTVGLIRGDFAPKYPKQEITVIIDSRTTISTRTQDQFVLRCSFLNDTEIVVVLDVYILSERGNLQDYYDLSSVEIGEHWAYTLKIINKNGTYYVIDLVAIHDNYLD